MKKKALVAMLLACSFAFGTASMTACNIIGGGDGTGPDTEQSGGTTVAVNSVSLNKSTLNLKVGGSETLTATVNPANATNSNVTWKSDNEAVATVDQSGKVTAKAKGTAIITVTTASGAKTDTCTVTVSENTPATVKVDSVKLNKNSATLTVGDKLTLTHTITPSNATNQNVRWTSSSDAATVVGGVVTAAKVGKATITVITEDGEKTASCEVTVQAATPATTKVTGVTVNPTSATLKVGATTQLTKTIAPANATNQSVTWTSGDTSVATVDGNGLVTAVSAGTTSITVKTADGNFTATCSVTVQQPATDPVVDAKITYAYAGNESAAFEWADNNAAGADVEYKLSGANTYTKLSGSDKQFLIRQKSATTARVDLVGLKGGAVYDFKITTSGKEVLTASDVTIHSYDRSGYAHFNKSDGVGAYKDDGTAKNNAVIVYVNEDNKNTVTANGKTGLINILKSASASKPLIVRVVGTVGSATWNEKIYNGGKAFTDESLVVGINDKKLPTSSSQLTQDYVLKNGYNTLN